MASVSVGLPRYQVISEELRELAGHLPPHTVLPSEHALMERFGVSRGTVRQALDWVERQGVVYRRKGKGTFVAPPRIRRMTASVPSFTEDISRRGGRLVRRVRAFRAISADSSVAAQLGLQAGTEVWEIDRLFLADDEPLAVITSFLPTRLAPTLSRSDVESSLYEALEQAFGARPVWARDEYVAVKASGRQARELDVPVGEPLLLSRRVGYTVSMEEIEFSESLIRADRFALTIEWLPEGPQVH